MSEADAALQRFRKLMEELPAMDLDDLRELSSNLESAVNRLHRELMMQRRQNRRMQRAVDVCDDASHWLARVLQDHERLTRNRS